MDLFWSKMPRGMQTPVSLPVPKCFLTMSSQATKEELYSLSDQKIKEFQEVLQRFSKMLQTRKAFDGLGILMREPRDFDLDYVLSVATRISEKRQESENARRCKRFVRTCCKTAIKHKDVVNGLISLAPSDVYGSLITGGFTVILAVSILSAVHLPRMNWLTEESLSIDRPSRATKSSATTYKKRLQRYQQG